MSETKTYAKSLAKGLLAGLIGGLVAIAVKTVVENIYRPQSNEEPTHGEPEPAAALVDKMAGHELTGPGPEKTVAVETIHWGFGALSGAAYGALAEYYPAATAKDGAGFGMALASLTGETALPALGLSAEAEERTPRERTGEMASHVAFGMVTETVRRLVRRVLG